MTPYKQRILEKLQERGEEGVHSFEFYRNYMPTFSQRIGELIRDGYKIQRVNRGSKGSYYFLKG